MFVVLRVIALPDAGKADAVTAALRDGAKGLPGVLACWAAIVSAGLAINAGNVILRLGFATEAEALRMPYTSGWATAIAPLLEGAQVTTVGYSLPYAFRRSEGPGIWRALVFGILPGRAPEDIQALETAILRMPDHLAIIRAWALSRVAYSEGPKAFTHVWEQEFDSIEALIGPYMNDPIHWGLVDAWFDAEYPEYIVDPHLIQIVGAIDAPLLTGKDQE